MGQEQDIVRILESAVETERRARKIYLDAAEKASDPITASVFEALADDELEHERIIVEFWKAVERGAEWSEDEVDASLTKPAEGRIKDILSRCEASASDDANLLDVYETAANLERETRDFYREQADAAEDIRAKRFFTFLTIFEDIHLSMLDYLIDRSSV